MLTSLLEAQRALIQEQNSLVKHWKPYIEGAENGGVKLSDERKAVLARKLENTQIYFENLARGDKSLLEATSAHDVGPFRYHAFEIITAMTASSIAPELCSEQPLPQKQGQIFYLDYLFGSNKGSIEKGKAMWSSGNDLTTAQRNTLGLTNGNSKTYSQSQFYASEIVDGEQIADGDNKDITASLGYYPVLPGTVKIVAGSITVTDNGSGALSGTGLTSGTINYTTGAVVLHYVAAPEADVTVDYEYDQGFAPAMVPQVDLQVRQSIITARSHKLRTQWSYDAYHDLKIAHGLDMEDLMLETVSAELRHETDAQIILDMYNQAALTTGFNMAYDPSEFQFPRREYYMGFIDTIVAASNSIFQSTRRAQGNWIVVGKKAADILESIGAPRFVGNGPGIVNGPHYAGLLDNKWKVYKDPFLPENAYLIGYKGNSFLDAGYIYAPYLPVFVTQTVMLDDFVGRKGFATSFGKRMINPYFYVKGTITES